MEGSIFKLELPFFGLTPEYRASLFTQLHDICFHGKGGYSFDIIYEFPIWLRKFVHRSMIEHYENENKQAQKSQGQQSLLQDGKIKAPDYSTKARR
jgi:hypothetical protein